MVDGSKKLSDHQHLSHPKYRADIDGLRAIAVLSVVGFHAFPGLIKGGFVGVDIFFVISGFLISTIIFENLTASRFSFVEFYARRVKRIFPALLLVLIACLAIGWFSFLADEYKKLGKHIVAGAGFVANLVLWSESGYFDDAAETKPLLHLWSLGIEEQFYIFWPLILWFGWKRKFNLLAITMAIVLASFGLNIYKLNSDLVATFYSPQTRFWELLIGSCLAYASLFKQRPLQNLKNVLGNTQPFIGLLLIGGGILFITKYSAFPGYWALLPTLGTALIIASGSQAWANRNLLSNRVLVWFGLISFPLYLWHWPLLVFLKLLQSDVPTHKQRIAAVLLSVALAWLTYKLIEKPLRFGKVKFVSTTLLTSMIAVAAIGLLCFANDGFVNRDSNKLVVLNEGEIEHKTFREYQIKNFVLCEPLELRNEALIWDGSVRCYQSRKGASDVVIIGDSHAEHLFIGLAENLKSKNVVHYIKGSAPFIDNKEFQKIYSYVIQDKNISTIVISAYWYDRLKEIPNGSSLSAELEKIIAAIGKDKKIYIADDVPNFPFSPKNCKYAASNLRMHRCDEEPEFFDAQRQKYIGALESLQNKYSNVKIVNTSKYFRNDNAYFMALHGKLFFRDPNHLSINGSIYLGEKIVSDFPEISQ